MFRKPWNPLIALVAKPAGAIGAWEGPTAYYLRVPTGVGPLVMGSMVLWDNSTLWRGTPEQVEQAIETIRRFIGQPGNEMILDVEIRAHATLPGLEYRKLFDPGGWTEWEFVELPEGPQGEEGVQGDRYEVYAEREAPNSFATLYRQLQVIGPEGEYVDQGEPEEISVVYDGWVHVGFYLPYATDNEDGTITFWRQWYCRVGPESNEFLPEGEPEDMGSAVLPEGPRGPVGGHYLITSDNPASNVAYFYRRYMQWNETTEEWDAVGEYEQFGGVVAPPGPEGDKGNYYLLTADNPPGEEDTVRLYRQLRDGQTGAALDDPEQIGEAVAVQGPPGEPGPIGPAGTLGNWTPFEDFLNSTEWQRLSWIARKCTEWAAGGMEATVRYTNASLGLGPAILATMGGFWGLALGGPAGALVGFGAGLGSGLLAPFADAALMNATEPFRNEPDLNDIAKDLYCSLVPYRDLSTASLDTWVTLYEGYTPEAQVALGNLLEGVQSLLARHWREIGLEAAQEEIAVILSRYEYDPYFDYTALPCTPDLGEGQEVFDFTIDDQGFVLWSEYSGTGEYIAEVGWHGTPGAGGDLVGIKTTLPESINILYVEVLYDLAAMTGSAAFAFGNDASDFVYVAPTVGVNQVWTQEAPSAGAWNGATFGLWAATWHPSAGLYVKRISLTLE